MTFGDNGLVDLKKGLDRDPETISRIPSNNPGRIFENLYSADFRNWRSDKFVRM